MAGDPQKVFDMSTPETSVHSATASDWTLEYLLFGDLVELLEEPYDDENRRWLLVVLDGLLDAIPAEGRMGRLAALREMFPNSVHLKVALTRLELEHGELIFQLRKLRNRVAWRLSVLDVVAAEVCRDLVSWLKSFRRFSEREARFQRQASRISGRQVALNWNELLRSEEQSPILKPQSVR